MTIGRMVRIMQDLSTRKSVAFGKETGGLYTCTPSTLHSTSESCTTSPFLANNFVANKFASENFVAPSSTTDLYLFRARLGHSSMSKLSHLNDCINSIKSDFFCETCILAKHHWLSFTRSCISSSNPYEMLHVDLWGPYKAPTFNGALYFLTIVDDKSRSTWTY